jgi:hypothetical protein
MIRHAMIVLPEQDVYPGIYHSVTDGCHRKGDLIRTDTLPLFLYVWQRISRETVGSRVRLTLDLILATEKPMCTCIRDFG